jgi:hypothetical protein
MSISSQPRKHPDPDRHKLVMEELARQMQAISEEAFCSSWGYRIEDLLPPVLLAVAASGQAADFQGASIRPLHAQWLVSLAEELGQWVTLDHQGNPVPYHPPSHSGVASRTERP